ncbi:Uncharacterised protein [Budvicia aquatica]|uniref:Transposase and inactivated derivatives n=1 Tax=Budvicia aquatica TaxID=82979 RepID=A0A484ZFB6_9GAMM|nr:Uncharacterised protein [Budvicia aquatica]
MTMMMTLLKQRQRPACPHCDTVTQIRKHGKAAVAYRVICASVAEARFKAGTFTPLIKRMGMTVSEANRRGGITTGSVRHESDRFGYGGQCGDLAGDSGDGPHAMVILLPRCGQTSSLRPGLRTQRTTAGSHYGVMAGVIPGPDQACTRLLDTRPQYPYGSITTPRTCGMASDEVWR